MKLMTIEQLSELISVKKKTIYDWTHKGLIPYIKLGRLLRFDAGKIEKWIKNNEYTEINRG
ncbi:MAG: helix-turn-helix domain-containing protein [bacterium]